MSTSDTPPASAPTHAVDDSSGGNTANSAANSKVQEADPHPQPKAEGEPNSGSKKIQKYKTREITMLERAGCGGCDSLEQTINNQIKPNSDVETILKKVSYDSPEGKAWIREKDIKYSPYLRECLIPTDPNEKPECHEYKSAADYKFKLKVNE